MREEGIIAGLSSGAAYAAFLKIRTELKGKSTVMIFPDTGYRYMNSELFEPECIRAEEQSAISKKLAL